VSDDLAIARVGAVTGRARVVRRRRAAGVGTAAVVALVTAAALSALPGNRDVAPARAPDSLTSLGWTYRLADTLRTGDDRVREELERSELPRLVSWSTTGDDQQVVVRFNGETWTSELADFGDFVWVPPNFGGEMTISGAAGLTMATYELDESVIPPGVGSGAATFREDVAGRELVGAAVGDLGQAELIVPVDAERGTLWLAHTCEGMPSRGYEVRIGVVGESGFFSSGDSCTSGSGFDPGGRPNLGTPGPWGPGASLRITVTRGGQVVPEGTLSDLRLGLAAYASSADLVVAAGHDFPRVIEHAGKVWQLDHVAEGAGAQLPRVTVPDDGQYVVANWVVASPQTPYVLSVDGSTEDQVWVSGIGASGSGARPVGSGQDLGLEIRGDEEDITQAALVLYQRVD
jgi:hypothetical protein